MKTSYRSLLWPRSLLSDSISRLVERRHPSGLSLTPTPLEDDELERWLDSICQHHDLEAQELLVRAAEVEPTLRSLSPLIVKVDLVDEDQNEDFFLVLKGGGKTLEVCTPTGQRSVPLEAMSALILEPLQQPHQDGTDALLNQLRLPKNRSRKAKKVLLASQLDRSRRTQVFHIRPRPSAPARDAWQGRRSWLTLPLLYMLGSAMFVASWWLLGRAAVRGYSDAGWLWGWTLMVLWLGPLRGVQSWLEGRIAVHLGAWLKARLLHGALFLDPDQLRKEGYGALMGRVFEAETVERLGFGASSMALLAGFDLIFAGWVLAYGAGAWLSVLGYLLSLALLWAGLKKFLHLLSEWVDDRFTLTQLTIEHMLGHATRLVQEPLDEWHRLEEPATSSYAMRSEKLDAVGSFLTAFLPRFWVLIGVLSLVRGVWVQSNLESLAIAVGGTLLAYSGFSRIGLACQDIGKAWFAWRSIARLYRASKSEPKVPDLRGTHAPVVQPMVPLVELQGVSYTYPLRERTVLESVDLRIADGERLLIGGPSGGGKSTLVQLLSGTRVPTKGIAFAGALDRQTRGLVGWRRWVVSAPQFHNNHVFLGTFAYNLLMGRRWPASPIDLRLAEEILEELDLQGLVEKMPNGLQQPVGETGWQLSHGERSRLYVARALLQETPVVVLDESLAALDAETLNRVLDCIMRRGRSLVLVAHL